MTAAVSLCIPTYNRAARLASMLRRLATAVRAHPQGQRFEICISDNGSQDDTPKIIESYAREGGDIVIRRGRHECNLGFARNFAAVAQLAAGDAFVVLADDDALEDGAFDLLLTAANQLSASCPLILFNSLLGGDAVARKLPVPTTKTAISGPLELLRQLGIFHASFVSNLMFHRETALAALTSDMLLSRYPHTALALKMLRNAPATFLPGTIVRVSLPPDAGDQPLLTSVDMPRVMSEYAFDGFNNRRLVWRVYSFLLKMLPTAIYQQRTGRCRGDNGNPYANLSLANVLNSYRRSRIAQLLAAALWSVSRILPLPMLRASLRPVSRHPR